MASITSAACWLMIYCVSASSHRPPLPPPWWLTTFTPHASAADWLNWTAGKTPSISSYSLCSSAPARQYGRFLCFLYKMIFTSPTATSAIMPLNSRLSSVAQINCNGVMFLIRSACVPILSNSFPSLSPFCSFSFHLTRYHHLFPDKCSSLSDQKFQLPLAYRFR